MEDDSKICPDCGQDKFIIDCVKCEVRCIHCGYIVPWIKVEVQPATDNEMAIVRVYHLTGGSDDK